MSTILCPACRSTLAPSVGRTGRLRLGIVRMTKPASGERWAPRRRRRTIPGPVRTSRVPARALTAAVEVANAHGVNLAEVRAVNRSPQMVRIRWVVMKAARDAGASLTQVGTIVERDHTTVLHGLRQLDVVGVPR